MNEYSEAEALALIRLRHWQHLLNEMLKDRTFKVPVHLAIGHEAAAVAMDVTLQPDDVLCLTHRNGAYNLARAKSLHAELKHYLLEEPAGGASHMASMNLALDDTGIMYASSILGNNLAVACGIAFNRKLTKRPGVVFATSGDGAIEEGVFWESLVFAQSHELRGVIALENNDFSLGSSIAERRCEIDVSRVCAAVGASYRRADGARLADIKATLQAARDDALRGAVSVVELDIKTFNQHAGPTPGWPADPRRISIADGLLMTDRSGDPLDHLRQTMGQTEFDALARVVVQESYDV